MWILHATNEQGSSVIMRFDSLEEAASSVDTLMQSGYTSADISLVSNA